MKIKNIIIKKKNKLIQLQILKSKLYKKKLLKKYTKKIETDIYKLYFKKIANIIYEYHVNNKKILFLNFPQNLEKKIIKIIFKTKHLSISFENLHTGIFTNKKIDLKQIQSNKISTIKLTNNFDLVLLFHNNMHFNKKNKFSISKIPTILITNDLNNNQISEFKVQGNFKFIEKQIINNLFLCILKSILKRAEIKKSSKSFKNLKFKILKTRRKQTYKGFDFLKFQKNWNKTNNNK